MDLQLPVMTLGKSANAVEILARAAIDQINDFNPDLYDHIMFILDPTISTAFKGRHKYVSYAYLNGKYSVFDDQWATRPSFLIHELGHNLGYHDSGLGTDQYGDQSDMMGYSYDRNERPLMCFNAAKSWYLNWYSIRHAYTNPLNTNGNV